MISPMKNLLAAFFLFAFALTSSSQELWLNEVDDFTGACRKVTSPEVIGDNGKDDNYDKVTIRFSALRINDSRAFRLKSSSHLGCAGADGNYAMLKFSDDTVIKFDDTAEINCQDMASSTFLVSDEMWARIEANDAPVMIRLKQSEYYTDAKTVNAEMWNAHWAAVGK